MQNILQFGNCSEFGMLFCICEQKKNFHLKWSVTKQFVVIIFESCNVTFLNTK
jgi:hypothetical protein